MGRDTEIQRLETGGLITCQENAEKAAKILEDAGFETNTIAVNQG